LRTRCENTATISPSFRVRVMWRFAH